jgi:hypothetical protein
MTDNYPYLKDYTKETGGIVVFQHRARFMSIGGSIGQILCVVIGIVSLINVYPIKFIWSVIFFFIFGHIGSRFNRKAMMKEMSKVFALKLENSKNLETRSKYFLIFKQYHKTLDAESAKYQEANNWVEKDAADRASHPWRLRSTTGSPVKSTLRMALAERPRVSQQK